MCILACIILTSIILTIMEGLEAAFIYLAIIIGYPALLILASGIITVVLARRDEDY